MTQSTSGKALEFQDFQWANSGGESTTTSDTWQSKLSKTFKKVVAGTYQITWCCQFYVVTGGSTSCEIRFMRDGAKAGGDETQTGDLNQHPGTYIQYEAYTAASEPLIGIEFRRQGTSDTVGIKRAMVAIVRVGD